MQRQPESPAHIRALDEAARARMIEKNLPLVRYVLSRMSFTLPPHLEEEDLAEAGVVGLIRAVQEFDPTRQTQFSTFAVPRIRGAILDELRSHHWVPRTARQKAADVTRAADRLRGNGRGEPSPEDIAGKLQTSVSRVLEMLSHARATSFSSLETLSEPDRNGNRVRIADTLEDTRTPPPDEQALLREMEELLTEAIKGLPRQERIVVSLYYFGGLMLKEIAEVLGVSKPRVSQIHSKALELLRSAIEGNSRHAKRSAAGSCLRSDTLAALNALFEQAQPHVDPSRREGTLESTQEDEEVSLHAKDAPRESPDAVSPEIKHEILGSSERTRSMSAEAARPVALSVPTLKGNH